MRLPKAILLFITVLACNAAFGQRFLMDMVDTSTEMGKGMLSVYQKYGSLRFSGYIQPQFQWTEAKGAKNFNGGDFSPNSNNRFMLRRSRIRVDHAYYNKKQQLASYFVFQVEVTERGTIIRDVWGRIFEHQWDLFSFNMGMMARPFSYEVNLASSDRESPERGRMSQILMKAERDLGASISFEPRKKDAKLNFLKIDVGVFNGPGVTATTDYDSYKDLAARITLKPMHVGPVVVSAGASILYGAVGDESPWKYETKSTAGGYAVTGDSSQSHINEAMPRHYYGADLQVKHPDKHWTTEVRGEFIIGTQTATAGSSETPAAYPFIGTTPQPLYIRQFNGAYFYFLQNVGSSRHQVGVKYDWYDPNTLVAGNQVTAAKGFSAADVRFNTLGFGYIFYVNPHLRAMLWYEMIKNENTAIAGYTTDAKDDNFTCRLQYRF